MKKTAILMAFALSTISTAAFAGEFDDIQVDIISWCEKEKVMAYDQENNVTLKFDCASRNESCRPYQIVRFNRVIHVATCAAN